MKRPALPARGSGLLGIWRRFQPSPPARRGLPYLGRQLREPTGHIIKNLSLLHLVDRNSIVIAEAGAPLPVTDKGQRPPTAVRGPASAPRRPLPRSEGEEQADHTAARAGLARTLPRRSPNHRLALAATRTPPTPGSFSRRPGLLRGEGPGAHPAPREQSTRPGLAGLRDESHRRSARVRPRGVSTGA